MTTTTSVHLDGGINALATNREKTRVAAAGRLVFKVYDLEEGFFKEHLDLRIGRINLNYSSNDLAWNPVNDELLATGATNGAVVTWNLGIERGNKMEHVFSDNKRTVNKVCFHPSEWYILLSGSSGGVIKYFDLKSKQCVMTFASKETSCGSIRDIQFNPHNMFMFASAADNGYIQFWDYRRSDRFLFQHLAHQEIVFSLDWHPEEMWLASSGRDKTIKIWRFEGYEYKLHEDYTLYHIQSVRKVKWRPQRKYHIASCSQVDDNTVSVWDIRRPYVPFAVFEEHKEAPTGIEWYDQNTFLTSGKDGMIYQHVFKDAKKPAENPVGISMSPDGNIFHIAVQSARGSFQNSASLRRPMFFRRPDRLAESFITYDSALVFYELQEDKFSEWFCATAERYQLTGKPFGELCETNAKVAEDLGRHQVAQTWHLLGLFFVDVSQLMPKVYSKQSSGTSTEGPTVQTYTEADRTRAEKDTFIAHREVPTGHYSAPETSHAPDSTTGVTDEESDSELERTKWRTKMPPMDGIEDPFTMEDEENFEGELGDMLDLSNTDQWALPAEGFSHRHEIIDRDPSPDITYEGSRPSSPPTNHPEHLVQDAHPSASHQLLASQAIDQAITKHRSEFDLSIKYRPLIRDMLNFYADAGDIQMAVSAYIVLGDRIKGEIPSETIEHWFTSYTELLSIFKLWTIANHVIKLSDHPNIQMLNQQSTTIYTNCNHCEKAVEKHAWACSKCSKLTNMCSFCHLPVKGLYTWCQGCSHGGHIGHMREWFSKTKECPTGCGHQCELK